MAIDLKEITDVYVLGDSLSDTGNLFTLTMEQTPVFPYDRGRFSNGLVAVEYLADRLQSDSDQTFDLTPSLLGGNNFAVGGATTGRDNLGEDDSGIDLPGLLDQVEVLTQQLETTNVESAEKLADPNALYIAWAGANNALAYLTGNNPEDPALLLEQGVNDYVDSITQLIDLGARNIVIPNLPNLGRLPNSGAFRTDASVLTRIFNGDLALALGNLDFELDPPDFTVLEVDLFARSEEIVADPQSFDITNTTDPLLPLVVGGQLPTDASGFFFWDEVHPTTQGHALFADTIFNTLTSSVPQPSFNDILGTPDSDFLLGTRQADNIDGFAGDDKILGLAGADRIEGWQGDDWLFGNGDDDILNGGVGDDILFGGAGADLILGKSGHDWQYGGQGDDVMVGGGDRDRIWGGAGEDFILGGAGHDSLWGNQSDDTLIGGAGHDIAKYLHSSNDYIFKGHPDDIMVIGPDGRDSLNSIEALEFSDGLIDVEELTFLPAPLFNQVQTLETELPDSGDAVDIYYPVVNPLADGPEEELVEEVGSLPVALFLQGANVDKSNYAEFASVVASYGFVVLVPNNLRTLDSPPPVPSETGFFPELPQVSEVLDTIQNSELSSIADLVDPEKLVLLGHSFGGAVGLSALQEGCPANFPVCPLGDFERSNELAGAAFFGTSLRPPVAIGGGEILPIDNGDIPTALIFGDNDGITSPEDNIATYDALLNPPKALVEVMGTNHYGITDSNFPTNPPEVPDAISPPIENNAQRLNQTVAIDTIATWSAQFLRSTVLEDPIAFDFVFGGIGDSIDNNVEVVTQRPGDLLAPDSQFLPSADIAPPLAL
ncbi:MAG: SGNH/GDSL hydrolase family protein [Cyanobacteria bacterium P01_G01_bin.54]